MGLQPYLPYSKLRSLTTSRTIDRWLAVLFLIVACCDTQQAFAATMIISASGTIDTIAATDVNGNDDTAAFLAILPFDQSASVTLRSTYSLDAVDENTPGFSGRYFSGTTTLTIGGTSFTYENDIRVTDRPSNVDDLRIVAKSPTLAFEGADGWDLDFVSTVGNGYFTAFRDDTSELIDGSALPNVPFSTDDLSTAIWLVQALSPNSRPELLNTVTTPLGSHTGKLHEVSGTYFQVSTQLVPEPTGVAPLLVTGLAIICGHRKRRFVDG